ncbi:hypothetical protein MLD38_005061 [Melastoma candidum]|uniref:Uncharacterized protein n=1 Tax=Melastoma candidum TaxID=119954 RepID=A0ACB9SBK1_9MYRT|nr:hypothetical protein MLD38_005061 [Melastoma candidum]
MDANHSGELLKHLEKQNDLLMEAYRSMSLELHKLQVEEEMLMRKFYDIMEAEKSMKKDDYQGSSNDQRNGDSQSPVREDNQSFPFPKGNGRLYQSPSIFVYHSWGAGQCPGAWKEVGLKRSEKAA